MFLLTLIVLNLDPKLGDLLFMIVFSGSGVVDGVEIGVLSLFAASLLKKARLLPSASFAILILFVFCAYY